MPRNGVEPSPSRPIPQRVTRSSSSSSTATVAPAIAKSPWRRANSSHREAGSPDHTGNRTARQDLVGRQRRLPQAGEEVGGRDLAGARATTSPRSSRRVPARRRRTRPPGRRARSRRRACPGCGSGSGRCSGVDSVSSGTESATSSSIPTSECGVAAPIRHARRRTVRCSAVRRFGRCRSDSRSASAASRASAPGSARPRGSSRRHRTRRAVCTASATVLGPVVGERCGLHDSSRASGGLQARRSWSAAGCARLRRPSRKPTVTPAASRCERRARSAWPSARQRPSAGRRSRRRIGCGRNRWRRGRRGRRARRCGAAEQFGLEAPGELARSGCSRRRPAHRDRTARPCRRWSGRW